MRVGVKNLYRKEIRECHYAYVERNILVLHITGFKMKLKFEFLDKKEAEEVLEKILTNGYYDFERRDFEVIDM